MDIYIIGGGASGVLCALEISKNKNHKVHIIEKNNKLMKKLLLTGNGSCNFTNDDFDLCIENYYNNNFLENVFSKFNNKDLIEYFNNIGIYWKSRTKYGINYFYPSDYSAKSVYYNIYDKLVENNIDIIYEKEVLDIVKNNNKYIIKTVDISYNADIVILATGGMSYKRTGSDGKLFDILKNLNVDIVKPIPTLCPLIHNDIELNKFKGIRQIVKISSYIENRICYEEIGEIQFNENNVSGIPILNISHKIGRHIDNKKNCYILIDFLYDIEDVRFLYNRKLNLSKKSIMNFLCSIVDNRIALFIYKKLNINNLNDKVENLSNKLVDNIFYELKNFKINISSLSSFEIAQVTKGGIDIKEIDNHFQLNKYKNIFAIGEMIDIDGLCGGYNLTYAFISGIIVGQYIMNNY